jgi:uncharacterized radical SAM superfamily Fe-S cluster-containing enzyme
MSGETMVNTTESLCPVCLKKIDANIVSKDQQYYLEKVCPEHGHFRSVVWRGTIPMESWARKKGRVFIINPQTEVEKGCPYDCGICSEHRQYTCLALIEVTKNCNLHCTFCFADAEVGKKEDPTLEHIKFLYESVMEQSGVCSIQISGGEPTTRDDLPEIIKMGTEMGFTFIQLNTNGIRLAEDEEYVKELRTAGLSSVFLQFDGTNDTIFKELRGKRLLEIKRKAIENCEKNSIGVVLVPTVVPGVNVDNIGEIIKFALDHAPAVRGVHFQPVSYFGRIPSAPLDQDRITLPEVIEEIDRQTEGRFSKESFKPTGSENSLCSFNGSYIFNGKDNVMNVTNFSSCCSSENPAEGVSNCKDYISRTWSFPKTDGIQENELSDWDKILYNIQHNSFSLSGMAFQDVWNINLERLKDCCIHVVSPEGKLIPFCAYNLTDTTGRFLYR